MADWFALCGLKAFQNQQTTLALRELAANAIEWGHRHDRERRVEVCTWLEADRVGVLVRDSGPGFDRADLPHAARPGDGLTHLDFRAAVQPARGRLRHPHGARLRRLPLLQREGQRGDARQVPAKHSAVGARCRASRDTGGLVPDAVSTDTDPEHSPPDWQLPDGVNRACWDYLHNAALARGYDEALPGSALFRADEAFVVDHCPPGRLVDLGCGTGPAADPAGPARVVGSRRRSLAGDAGGGPRQGARGRRRGVACSGRTSSIWPASPPRRSTTPLACSARSAWSRATPHGGGSSPRPPASLRPGGRFVLHVHNRWFHLWDRAGRRWLLARPVAAAARRPGGGRQRHADAPGRRRADAAPVRPRRGAGAAAARPGSASSRCGRWASTGPRCADSRAGGRMGS